MVLKEMATNKRKSLVRLHLTNVTGAGASHLLKSLLPAIENDPNCHVERIDLPSQGDLVSYQSVNSLTIVEVYKRYLPISISRFLECSFFAAKFDGSSPLLVLGDLPLRCRGPQTVFLQSPHIVRPQIFVFNIDGIKFWISRIIFKLNMSRVHSFVVQTEVMREAVERSFPVIAGRVHVIAQPVPAWLLKSGLHRVARLQRNKGLLSLIYPATYYPHKNHSLLSLLDAGIVWPIEELTLTIAVEYNPAPNLSWVQCKGFLSPAEMIDAYSKVDALLFLSKDESYGFPLLEAMFVGLPIICPDLPYAHTLCGDTAIYFDPDKPDSLLNALQKLQLQLKQGWWPNWSERLKTVPKDWATVARSMLNVACST